MDSLKFKSLTNPHLPRKFAFKCEGESLTQQQFKEECDVNNILAKYKRTGLLSHFNKHQGNFGDFSNLNDYQTNLDKIRKAHESFDSLPSEVRSKFNNDPGLLIEFLSDSKNDSEAIKLGLKQQISPTESIQSSMEKALEANDLKRSKSKLPKD